MTQPTQEEIEYLVSCLGLDSGFVSASLDEEEASRMEKEDDQTFVVVDVPYRVEDRGDYDNLHHHPPRHHHHPKIFCYH